MNIEARPFYDVRSPTVHQMLLYFHTTLQQ